MLTEAQVPAMPILSLTDLLDDPHLDDAGFWVERDSARRARPLPGDSDRFFRPRRAKLAIPARRMARTAQTFLREAGFEREHGLPRSRRRERCCGC